MDLDVQNHLAALIRARQLQVHAAAASNLSHIYGLQTPDAPFAPPATVGLGPLHANEGAVSEAPGQQLLVPAPYAWLNAAAPTAPVATAPIGHSVIGGGGAVLQDVVLAPPAPETDPMKIALIPPTDITPEAAVVSYPKPIHTNANPLNRAPQGALQPRSRDYTKC